ncbi:ClbS/DfsB family four-helix bundle protein [Flammeovirga sp. MY04]|nr:ClbS/DfsB family four-helix bundle protein [Flammeovirga sp. MY04]ANQ51465.1 ClbS/DfsB family four-helix bundle protein [Flammeovirga sp. MY04]
MARPTTKIELIETAAVKFDKLWEVIDSIPQEIMEIPFDFSNDPKKKEAHWTRDKNLRDVLVHLFEWHELLLNWINSNSEGEEMPFLPHPYNWKTYGELNQEFWCRHQETKLESAKEMLKLSHNAVMELIEEFTDKQLFTKKYFDWTGTTTLGSYCVSATSSHYDWAIKKLRAHKKNVMIEMHA